MDDDLKEIRAELRVIRESQVRTEADLNFHILRTNKLEELIKLHEATSEKQVETLSDKISKIEIPYKVSLFILSAAGLITLIQQIISFTKH